MFSNRNELLNQAKKAIKECDAIIERLEAKGRDVYKSKRLISELEQEVKELQGMRRSRFSDETYYDIVEIAEFYLVSLKKGGRIL